MYAHDAEGGRVRSISSRSELLYMGSRENESTLIFASQPAHQAQAYMLQMQA